MLNGREALARVGLEPIELAPKEALALISANGVTLGRGSLGAARRRRPRGLAAGRGGAFARGLQREPVDHSSGGRSSAAPDRPQHGGRTASRAARRLRTSGSPARRATFRTRCPSAACRGPTALFTTALAYARATLEAELNAANDNPLVLLEQGAIVSVGNFDVAGVAMAFDLVRIAIAHAVKVANERVQKLLWQHFSGLPSELAIEQGPTNGLKPMGRWCAALSGEARSLANAVSLDYVGQVAEGVEDHASMAPARRAPHLRAGVPCPSRRRARADHRRPGDRHARAPAARPRDRSSPTTRCESTSRCWGT